MNPWLVAFWWWVGTGAAFAAIAAGILAACKSDSPHSYRDSRYSEWIATAFLWPFSIALLTLLGIVSIINRTVIPEFRQAAGSADAPRLSRKQRRALEFERQQAAIAQERLEAQQLFEKSIEQMTRREIA